MSENTTASTASMNLISVARRRAAEFAGFSALRLAVLAAIGSLVAITLLVTWHAWPALSWELLTEPPRDLMTKGGIWPCIAGTFCLAGGALVIALPFGVLAAIYLTEYGQRGSIWTEMARLSAANLAGVPSIVFGLFGLTFFCSTLGLRVSLLSGVLTLAVLSLPVIISTTEAALSQVPQAWREASMALGATRSETVLKVVLPNALPGVLTGAILALARAAGETAAIMYTGSVFFTPREGVSLFEPVMALPYHIYVLATSGTQIEQTRPLQYAASLVLLLLVLVMSLAAIIIRERRRGGD